MSDKTDEAFEETIKKIDRNFNELLTKGIKDFKTK